jgi:hypothetical protein
MIRASKNREEQMGSGKHSSQSWVIVLVALCSSVYLSGCSISKSIESSSDIISSPIKSSSNSSSPEDEYENDVRDYTAAYLKSGGDASKLEENIAPIAEKRGVSDWEESESTYQGIGAGLAKAKLNQAELDAYKQNIAADEEQAQWMQKGYDSYDED